MKFKYGFLFLSFSFLLCLSETSFAQPDCSHCEAEQNDCLINGGTDEECGEAWEICMAPCIGIPISSHVWALMVAGFGLGILGVTQGKRNWLKLLSEKKI